MVPKKSVDKVMAKWSVRKEKVQKRADLIAAKLEKLKKEGMPEGTTAESLERIATVVADVQIASENKQIYDKERAEVKSILNKFKSTEVTLGNRLREVQKESEKGDRMVFDVDGDGNFRKTVYETDLLKMQSGPDKMSLYDGQREVWTMWNAGQLKAPKLEEDW